jgi:hypothetical protein
VLQDRFELTIPDADGLAGAGRTVVRRRA